MGLSFTIAFGPRQRTHSQVWVPRDSWPHFTRYCLRCKTPPTWRAGSPYLYRAETGWPGYTFRHWVPFSSPPTTRRVTVEVFDPASTQAAKAQLALLVITSRHGQHIQHRSSFSVQFFSWEHVCLRSRYSAMALIYLLIWRSLPSNGSTC
jgi:hypothetical protein